MGHFEVNSIQVPKTYGELTPGDIFQFFCPNSKGSPRIRVLKVKEGFVILATSIKEEKFVSFSDEHRYKDRSIVYFGKLTWIPGDC